MATPKLLRLALVFIAVLLMLGTGCKREKHMQREATALRPPTRPATRPERPRTPPPAPVKPKETPAPVAAQSDDRQVHTVEPGDSLWKLSRRYGIPLPLLAEYNELDRNASLRVGQTLLIPDADDLASLPAPQHPATIADKPARPSPRTGLSWPHRGEILRRYDGQFKGLDIAADTDDFVHAADKGEVIFADPMEGYGKLVIVDHLNGLFTIYGQLRTILVANGASVIRGQRLGRGGTEDERGRVRVYFEVRKAPRDGEDPVPVDPSGYLQ